MSLWSRTVTVESINDLHRNTAVSRIGIRFTEVGEETMTAVLAVNSNSIQPYGVLHGGVSLLLAETLASCAANVVVGPGQQAVGQEINANHLRAVRGGDVTGKCRAVHIGRRSQVWSVEIRDDESRLCCISRVTMAVIDRNQEGSGKDSK